MLFLLINLFFSSLFLSLGGFFPQALWVVSSFQLPGASCCVLAKPASLWVSMLTNHMVFTNASDLGVSKLYLGGEWLGRKRRGRPSQAVGRNKCTLVMKREAATDPLSQIRHLHQGREKVGSSLDQASAGMILSIPPSILVPIKMTAAKRHQGWNRHRSLLCKV